MIIFMEIKNKLKYNKNLFVYHYFIYIQIFHNAYTLTINLLIIINFQ